MFDETVRGRMNLILLLLATTVTAAVIDTEDGEVRIEEQNSTLKQYPYPGPTVYTDDKGFWDWLYGLVNTPQPVTEPPRKPETCPPCKCGLTNKHNRIVGGVETLVNEYPWMALLLYRGRFYCGATVINSRYVLTAAHCVDRFQPEYMEVRILEHDRQITSESKTQQFKVKLIKRHSAYSTTNFDNDIALVKLNDSIKFEGPMRPACLPERGRTFANCTGIATGWGATQQSGMISSTLREVKVPILTNAKCRMSKYPARRITDNMLCAGYDEGNKDSCQGDSGGPLHVVNHMAHHIVGVVSWGEGCAKPNYPGVYTRVNRYLTWIKRNVDEGCYCHGSF